MADAFTIKLKDLVRVTKKLSSVEDIATTRALNAVAGRGKRHMVDKISLFYKGIPKGSISKRITLTKATRLNKVLRYVGKSTRTNLIQPKKLKGGGISHKSIGRGGRRAKITGQVERGSTSAFLIRAKKGRSNDDIQLRGGTAKMVPVFVSSPFRKFKKMKARKVTTMKGSSVRQMMLKVGIQQKEMERFILNNFRDEYKKQIKRAAFTGSR